MPGAGHGVLGCSRIQGAEGLTRPGNSAPSLVVKVTVFLCYLSRTLWGRVARAPPRLGHQLEGAGLGLGSSVGCHSADDAGVI